MDGTHSDPPSPNTLPVFFLKPRHATRRSHPVSDSIPAIQVFGSGDGRLTWCSSPRYAAEPSPSDLIRRRQPYHQQSFPECVIFAVHRRTPPSLGLAVAVQSLGIVACLVQSVFVALS